jgi:predicted metal-dependent phosphoesterase TrpH
VTATSRHAEQPWDPVVPAGPSPVDLHSHTRRSDGILEPHDLVAQAYAAGVRLLSITDHDTLAGYRELVRSNAALPGLELLPGVEINAVAGSGEQWWEGELHILGFGMDPDDATFEAALAAQRGQRRRRFDRILERLRSIGMPVEDALAALAIGDDDALGRPTVARALMAKGHATSVEDAFRRLLGHGMPGWVPRDGLGPREAIEAVRAAGGLPVLAHFGEARERIGVLRELQEMGLAGLEVYYRSWDRHRVESVGEVAAELGLIPTGGSDYHGDLGPYAETHAMLWVPPDVGHRLRGALSESARRAI